MKKLKVLFIAPIRKGGPNILLNNLSNYLNENSSIDSDFYASIKGFLIGMFSRKYDVIHSVLPIPFNIWNKPILLHIHGDFRVERGLNNPLGFIYPLAILNAKQIIVPSIFLKNKINLKNCEVIPNFLTDEIFKFNKKYSNQKSNINLCCMTKFHFHEKARGVLSLVKIINELNVSKKITLNILGGGKYLPLIKKEVSEIRIKKNIVINFIGFVDNPMSYLVNQDIFTYYSYLDTFGISIIEAMGLGIPTITNDLGPFKEVIINDSVGFICSNEEYVEKLEKIINSLELQKELGFNSKEYIKSNFLISEVSKRFINKYNYLYNIEDKK
jgi:glycosyltransferase involved in cell wall biosynthesis